MTKEDIKKANKIIESIEQLERRKENIKKTHSIEFHVAPCNCNVMICNEIEREELKNLAILQIQTKIDKYNDKIKQLGLD